MLNLFHYSEGGFTLLAPYLIGNMKSKWISDIDGNVKYAGGSEESGE